MYTPCDYFPSRRCSILLTFENSTKEGTRKINIGTRPPGPNNAWWPCSYIRTAQSSGDDQKIMQALRSSVQNCSLPTRPRHFSNRHCGRKQATTDQRVPSQLGHSDNESGTLCRNGFPLGAFHKACRTAPGIDPPGPSVPRAVWDHFPPVVG